MTSQCSAIHRSSNQPRSLAIMYQLFAVYMRVESGQHWIFEHCIFWCGYKILSLLVYQWFKECVMYPFLLVMKPLQIPWVLHSAPSSLKKERERTGQAGIPPLKANCFLKLNMCQLETQMGTCLCSSQNTVYKRCMNSSTGVLFIFRCCLGCCTCSQFLCLSMCFTACESPQ